MIKYMERNQKYLSEARLFVKRVLSGQQHTRPKWLLPPLPAGGDWSTCCWWEPDLTARRDWLTALAWLAVLDLKEKKVSHIEFTRFCCRTLN